jgi:hypothetical protein
MVSLTILVVRLLSIRRLALRRVALIVVSIAMLLLLRLLVCAVVAVAVALTMALALTVVILSGHVDLKFSVYECLEVSRCTKTLVEMMRKVVGSRRGRGRMACGWASAIAASHARFKCDLPSYGADCARHTSTKTDCAQRVRHGSHCG